MHRNLKFLHMTIFFSTDILVGLVTNIRYGHKSQLGRPHTQWGSGVDKPARLIIRLLFGFGSDSVQCLSSSTKMKTNTETAMPSTPTRIWGPEGP